MVCIPNEGGPLDYEPYRYLKSNCYNSSKSGFLETLILLIYLETIWFNIVNPYSYKL